MSRKRRIPEVGVKQEECSECGWVWELQQMRSQNGGLVCPNCYDGKRRDTRKRRNSLK